MELAGGGAQEYWDVMSVEPDVRGGAGNGNNMFPLIAAGALAAFVMTR
jgi:hypothetical protein